MTSAQRNTLFFLCLILLFASGCVQRSLVISSSPAGARVFVDAKEIGTTPVELHFEHYGTREIILRHGQDNPALESAKKEVELSPPWHQYFPIDMFCIFLPLEDRHEVHFELQELDVEAHKKKLQKLADQIRDPKPADKESSES